jgi:hypothetical protein
VIAASVAEKAAVWAERRRALGLAVAVPKPVPVAVVEKAPTSRVRSVRPRLPKAVEPVVVDAPVALVAPPVVAPLPPPPAEVPAPRVVAPLPPRPIFLSTAFCNAARFRSFATAEFTSSSNDLTCFGGVGRRCSISSFTRA